MRKRSPLKLNRKLLKIILYLNFLCIIHAAHCQKRYNVWAFGDHAGLNFNHNPPTYLKTKSEGLRVPYYISSICDKEGNLIFYTDGLTVWDYNHRPLARPSNSWRWANNVMTLICPNPADDSLYYLFGISDGIFLNQLQYITIKSYLPYCQIVYSNNSYFTTIQQNASLLLAGTAHCNEKDTWIITHTPGAFNSFLVSATGISNTPVVTPISPSIIPAQLLNGGYSNLKFSANGEKMIVPLPVENKLVVFDFNNSNGTFSNPIKLSVPEGQTFEDIEISPDGSKVYLGSYEIVDFETGAEMHYIFQMNLNAGTAAQIQQTMTKVSPYGDRAVCFRICYIINRTMQLAPDGKIYISMREAQPINLDLTLSVITNPNERASDIFYRQEFQNVNRKYKFINYNYIRSSSFSLRENGIQVQPMICSDRPAYFSLLYNNVDSVKWDFGDPSSGSNNFSFSLKPQHVFPAQGQYNVQAIIYKNCTSDTARKTITIQQDKAVHIPEFIHDTTICVGSTLQLNAKTPYANTYLWENGLIYPQRRIDESGHYEVIAMNDCSMDKKSFDVIYKECPCESFIPTAFTPNNDGLNDMFKPVMRCLAEQYQLKIFSRYGDLIFETSDFSKGWNGKIKNTDASSGVYIWLLHYINPNNKQAITKKGTVTLIR